MIIKSKKAILGIAALIVLLVSITGFGLHNQAKVMPLEPAAPANDLPEIIENGVLRATTNYNSTNYFIYHGEPMGFHLELLRLFAAHIGVSLEVYVTNDLDESFDCLVNQGGCDVIALDLAVTRTRRQYLAFTEPHSYARQVLVQRKTVGTHDGREGRPGKGPVKSIHDLGGKTVHVQKNSSHLMRLHNLMEEIGDTIYIIETQEDAERLIEMVSRGEIEYTVSDEHLALHNSGYYSNIDVHLPLGLQQQLSWAVNPKSEQLLEAINEWLVSFRTTNQYVGIYNKYYKNPRGVFMSKSRMHSLGGGNVSDYDQYFRDYAGILGWDWRLIASMAFQESRFDPGAISWAGAFGLMQLMPETAEAYNVDPESPVSAHIMAAISYLRWLDTTLSRHIEDDEERIKFVLASYNAGIGHVLDARRLAEKYGKNPNIWKDNVDYYLLNKSKPMYYQDPVVRFGFVRGAESYNYVNEILERYSHYRNALQG